MSNPVDIIACYVYKVLGLPKSSIIGKGTSIDSLMIKILIDDLLNVNTRSVQTYYMGEYGDFQMIT